jgi:hypothetical protein
MMPEIFLNKIKLETFFSEKESPWQCGFAKNIIFIGL